MTLSSKHIEVRDYILRHQAEKLERPMYKEIMNACGIRSLRTVHKYVKALEKAGELRLQYTSMKTSTAGA